jgi:hypothetical protein
VVFTKWYLLFYRKQEIVLKKPEKGETGIFQGEKWSDVIVDLTLNIC